MRQSELYNLDCPLGYCRACRIRKPSLIHVAQNRRVEILDIAFVLDGCVYRDLQCFIPCRKKLAGSAMADEVKVDVFFRLLLMEDEADGLFDRGATPVGFKEPVGIIHEAGQVVGLFEGPFESSFQTSFTGKMGERPISK